MSTEHERADYYEEHKDNPDIWETPEEPAASRQRGTLGATITVRFSEQEATQIRNFAKASGQTYSQVVRTAVKNLTEGNADTGALDIGSGNINLLFQCVSRRGEHQPLIEVGGGLRVAETSARTSTGPVKAT